MPPEDLRTWLRCYGFSGPEFAKLVGVSSRAVSSWLTGERTIPGTVVAWCEVVEMLPAGQRDAYFWRRLRAPSKAYTKIAEGLNEAAERIDEFGIKQDDLK